MVIRLLLLLLLLLLLKKYNVLKTGLFILKINKFRSITVRFEPETVHC